MLDAQRRRERREDPGAVARRYGAPVEQRHQAPVAAAANQTPETLFETDGGGRNHVVLEAVETAGLERANPRHNQRVARRRKGKPVDDHTRKRIADDVDSLPERSGCKQHCAGRSSKPIDEVRARKLALQPNRKSETICKQRVDFPQPRVRGEEHEGTPPGSVETLFDERRGAARKIRRLWIDLRGRDKKASLARVVER